MFSSLGAVDGSNNFENTMHGYAGHSQVLTNTLGRAVSIANGLNVQGGDEFFVNDFKVSESRAATVQIWYKGSISDGTQFLSVYKDSPSQLISVKRLTNDFRVESSYKTSDFISLASAHSTIDTSAWAYLGISISWTGDAQNCMI